MFEPSLKFWMPFDFAGVEYIVFAVIDILLTGTWPEKSILYVKNLFKVLFEGGLNFDHC